MTPCYAVLSFISIISKAPVMAGHIHEQLQVIGKMAILRTKVNPIMANKTRNLNRRSRRSRRREQRIRRPRMIIIGIQLHSVAPQAKPFVSSRSSWASVQSLLFLLAGLKAGKTSYDQRLTTNDQQLPFEISEKEPCQPIETKCHDNREIQAE